MRLSWTLSGYLCKALVTGTSVDCGSVHSSRVMEQPRCLTQRNRNGKSGVYTQQLSAGVKEEALMLAGKETLLEVVKEPREPQNQFSCISSHFWLPDRTWVQKLLFMYHESRTVWCYRAEQWEGEGEKERAEGAQQECV